MGGQRLAGNEKQRPPRGRWRRQQQGSNYFGFDVCALREMREKETSPFLYFYFYSFGFWIMVLEQAALTHDIERDSTPAKLPDLSKV